MLAGGLYERRSGAAGQPLAGYRRCEPERTVLHELVARYGQTMLAEVRAADPEGGGLPGHVERELTEYLRCGVRAHGFVRALHERRGEVRIVATSAAVPVDRDRAGALDAVPPGGASWSARHGQPPTDAQWSAQPGATGRMRRAWDGPAGAGRSLGIGDARSSVPDWTA